MNAENDHERRRFLASLAALAAGGTLPLGALSADGSKTPRPGISPEVNAELFTPAAKQAVEAGLAWLARRQQSKGAIGSGQFAENIAVSSLAGLAFMAGGSQPGEGPYGANLDRLLEFVLDNVSATGYCVVMRSTSHGPMYDHGFGTLFLAEAYGMTRREDIREKLRKAVDLIVRSQNEQGGWRYQPQRVQDADISVTICMIMALRAARNAGLHVPKGCVEKCIEYVRRSQNADGGFRYMLPGGTPSAFARSAAGVVALYTAGVYEGRDIDRGLDYIQQFTPGRGGGGFSRRDSHYFYGHYYAVQAMYTAGGDRWPRWYKAVRDELVERARPDGSWTDSTCGEYGTAMACIILQIPLNFLPIFQR